MYYPNNKYEWTRSPGRTQTRRHRVCVSLHISLGIKQWTIGMHNDGSIKTLPEIPNYYHHAD